MVNRRQAGEAEWINRWLRERNGGRRRVLRDSVEGRENLCNDVKETQQESAGGCLKKEEEL